MMWWLLMGAMPIDPVGDPLPRYLTTIDVIKQLKLAEPALQACGVREDRTQGVSLQIHGDGSIQSIVWQDSTLSVHECWTTALNAHRFHAHDGLPVHLSTTVYVRDGQLMLSPQPEVVPRNLGPLMLFVLPASVEPVHDFLHGSSNAVER
jgi:hypothetical protein